MLYCNIYSTRTWLAGRRRQRFLNKFRLDSEVFYSLIRDVASGATFRLKQVSLILGVKWILQIFANKYLRSKYIHLDQYTLIEHSPFV